MTGVASANDQPFPERGETAEEFLDRYGQWVETIPAEDRAWDEMVVVEQLILDHFGSRGEITADPEDERWDQTIEFVQSNPELIDRIKQYSNRTHLGMPRDMMMNDQQNDPDHTFIFLDILLPHLGSIRDQVTLLMADSVLAAQNGDVDDSLDSLESIRRVQRFLPVSQALIEGLVEIACSALGSNIISENQLNLSELNEEQLLRLRMLYVDDPLTVDTESLYVAEQNTNEDLLNSFYKGSKGGRITLRGTQRFLNAVKLVYGDDTTGNNRQLAQTYRQQIAKFRSQKKIHDQYWTLFFNDLNKASHKIESYESQAYIGQYSGGEPSGMIEFGPAVLFIPSLRKSHTRMLQYRAHQSSYSLLIALHLHRIHNGSFPESYDELDDDLLTMRPTDPHTGNLIHFKINGTSIKIYSSGPDRDDDGGRPLMEDGNVVDWPDFLTLDEFDTVADPASIDGDWILYSSGSE